MTTRRSFLESCAACGGMLLPGVAFAASETPLLRFGVLSDIHIGGRKVAPERLKFALNWLAPRHVDAVLISGDITHSGLISEMERFAEIWNRVFPNGRNRDGDAVKLMISTGNHEAAATWIKGDDAWRTANVLAHRDNFVRTWDHLFQEKWELVWKREVKGYSFIGAQWGSLNPPLAPFMAAQTGKLDPAKPLGSKM